MKPGTIVKVYSTEHNGFMFGEIVFCEETKFKYGDSFHKVKFIDGSEHDYYAGGIYSPLTEIELKEYEAQKLLER